MCTGVRDLVLLLHSRFDITKKLKKEMEYHRSTYHIKKREGKKERSSQIFTRGIVRVHKPADKKIKNRERRTDDHKKGSKKREGKRVFIQDIYNAIRWAHRQANLGGRLLSEHSKGLTWFLTFLLPLIHGKGVYFMPKGKE
jgi:hypothetical protein